MDNVSFLSAIDHSDIITSIIISDLSGTDQTDSILYKALYTQEFDCLADTVFYQLLFINNNDSIRVSYSRNYLYRPKK